MTTQLFLSKKVKAPTIGIITAILTLSASLVYAQAAAPSAAAPAVAVAVAPGKNFTAHKEKELAHIAHRLQILQTLQSCVQAATDHAALKACHVTAKSTENTGH